MLLSKFTENSLENKVQVFFFIFWAYIPASIYYKDFNDFNHLITIILTINTFKQNWPILAQRKTSLIVFLWKRTSLVLFLATILFLMA